MKSHNVIRGGVTKSLHCVPILVPLLVAAWLLVFPAAASILQEGNSLELRPPSDQTGIYFGFSLAHYVNDSQRWLLVGAPRSSVSLPNVNNSGGLYQCPLSESPGVHECNEVHVDMTNKPPYPVGSESDGDEQSLGFSLASSDSEIVVCAPRRYATKAIYNRKSQLPVGICFSAKLPDYKFEVFSPPLEVDNTPQISFLTTGSCQFGMSVTYVKSKNTFALGGPGCYAWQGDTYEYGLDSKLSRHLGQLNREDLKLEQNDWNFFNLYMGYSVASFKFGGDSAILSSIPRAIWPEDSELNTSFGPTILILAQNPNDETTLSIKQRITPSKATAGEVLFSFFGYSLATLDVNGDGLEDLVVGAPFYQHPTNPNQGAAAGYDYGAIFVYMQTVLESHENKEKIYQMKEEDDAPQRKGSVSFSRFGSCVASVGDLDEDGYEDLAVGAPFMAVDSESGSGTGAVYIYMGSHSGLEKDPFQIIKAPPSQRGFGSSIAQQLEIVDGKGYDLAIGVYDSDKVLVYRSKDVVNVYWNLTFSGDIDLSVNSCACQQYGGACACVEAEVCVRYQKKFNKFDDDGTLDFKITLTTESTYELTFTNGEAEIQLSIEGKEGDELCETEKVMAKPGKEEIASYRFIAELSLAKEEENMILDRHSVLKKEERLNVAIHCASGDVSGCQSDINLDYDLLAPYIYDSQSMKIRFEVTNQGETAYGSKLIIKSIDVFNIVGLEANDNVVCDKSLTKEVECELGNLENNSKETFILQLTPSKESLEPLSVANHAPTFNLTAEVESLSSISNLNTAVKNIQVNISVSSSLELFKYTSEPSIVYFNSSSYYKSPEDAKNEEELGPEVKHKYGIRNSNDFSYPAADLVIHWPHTIDGKYFLYLMNEPEFSDLNLNPNCQYINGKVDPHSLAVKQMQPAHVTESPEDQSKGLKASALTMGIDSGPSDYITINCVLGEFRGKTEVTITLKSRLVLKTLTELAVGSAVESASSVVDLQITKMPFNVAPPEAPHSTIATRISYKDYEPEVKVPVWYYIVAGLGGILVLGIIVIIMWKCGFFKRKRPMEAGDKTKNNEEQEGIHEDEEAKLTEERDDDVKTPISPMLKETECAAGDFEFHKNT